MMPMPGQTAEQFLDACSIAAGEQLPRATDEDIACLKGQGYVVDSTEIDVGDGGAPITVYQWSKSDEPDEFQDSEPSYCEADSWALALQHARTPTGPY